MRPFKENSPVTSRFLLDPGTVFTIPDTEDFTLHSCDCLHPASPGPRGRSALRSQNRRRPKPSSSTGLAHAICRTGRRPCAGRPSACPERLDDTVRNLQAADIARLGSSAVMARPSNGLALANCGLVTTTPDRDQPTDLRFLPARPRDAAGCRICRVAGVLRRANHDGSWYRAG